LLEMVAAAADAGTPYDTIVLAACSNRLLQSLRSLAHRTRRRPGATRANLGTQDDGTPIDRLLIAYPPGVPLAVPGERWASTLRQRVAASRRGGAEVYQLPPGPSRHPREHVS
jgi:hypothetical protein